MHELGIASDIANIVQESLQAQNITRKVITVRLTVGEMRQIVPDSLQFCFDSVTQGTRLEGAVLQITHIPLGGKCAACGRTIEFTDPPFRCPFCGGEEMKMERGFEMEVASVEVED